MSIFNADDFPADVVQALYYAARSAYSFPVVLDPSSSLATINSNTAILSAALAQPGRRSIMKPGVYQINAQIPRVSNTGLFLGEGVEIKVADGSNCGAFTNAAATDPGILLGAGEVVWTYDGSGTHKYYGVVINHTGIGLRYPLGSLICIAGTTSHDYAGIWPVVESSPNSITYQIRAYTPDNGSGAPQGLGTTMKAYPVDVNMYIAGPGRINGNGVNQPGYGSDSGQPANALVFTRNAYNTSIIGVQVAPGSTWTLASNNVKSLKVQGIFADTNVAGSTDTVHLSGMHDGVLVEDVHGSCSDNMVGMTIDITPGTSYDFANQDPGDMRGVIVRRIRNLGSANANNPSATVGIYGPAAFRYNDITIEDIDSGSYGAVVSVANYSLTNMNNTNGGVLNVRRIRGAAPGAALELVGVANFDRVIVDDVLLPNGAATTINIAATGTVGELSISGLNARGNSRSAPAVNIGAMNVTSLAVRDCQGFVVSGGIGFVTHSGAGNIGKASFLNCSGSGTGSLWSHTGSGTVPTVVYLASTFGGAAL